MALSNVRRGKFPILVFHRINPHWDDITEPIHPDDFEKVILFMKKYYRILPVSYLAKDPPPAGCCFITFDDGMSDFITYAYPILEKHNVPCAMFLPTQSIDDARPIWSYQLFDMFNQTREQKVIFSLNDEQQEFILSSTALKKRAAMEIHSTMIGLTISEINRIIDKLKLLLNVEGIGSTTMSWDDIHEIGSHELIKFYSHTKTHTILPILSAENLEKEMKDSKKEIARKVPHENQFIAYPMGGYDQRVLEHAEKYFELGFSTDQKLVDSKLLDQPRYRMRLPRILVSGRSWREIFFRAQGFHARFSTLYAIIKAQ